MGFKRQRMELEQSDARETDAPDPTADLSLDYELELANFATIPDDDQHSEEEGPLPERKEPRPAKLDQSDIFEFFFRGQARSAFLNRGN